MKEKVLSLAKGNFTYEPPALILNPERLESQIVAGTKTALSFVLKNQRGSQIKGFGSVEEPAMSFLPVFHAEINELQVEVDAAELIPGETLKGEIHLVTDCGEAALPYDIKIIPPELADERGVINDYHKLRERFQENPEHGAALFHDPLFEEVFLYRDQSGRRLYHMLQTRDSRLHSMEEFLVAKGKKKPIRFQLKHPASGQKKKIEIEYEIQGADIQDSLQIRVNTWGSMGVQIRSTQDFIEPERHRLWTDEFVGSTAAIPFRILADRVPAGRRFGSLIVESLYETQEIRISAHNDRDARSRKVARARKAATALLVRTYLAWQEGRIEETDFQEMLRKNRVVIRKLSGEYELSMSGYIAVILKDEAEILNFYQKTEYMEPPQPGAGVREVENYILTEYVKYLYSEREEERQRIIRLLEVYTDNGYQSVPLFLMSLHVEDKYHTVENRAEALWQQLGNYPKHVLLHSELLRVFRQEPQVITTLDRDTLTTVCYGIRQGLITEEISLAVSYLAERAGSWDGLLFHVLAELYEQFEQEDTLRSICGLLIRSEKREGRYFPWFAAGVERHLRLTELYEYYMYTMDTASAFSLPDSVISYFQYENHLNDRCKAFLYAYIIKNQREQPEVFRAYGTHIREYALRQLERHRVTEDIAVIYEGLFKEGNIRDSVAKDLPYVMFNHLLICADSRMQSVLVIHTEMEEEAVYSLRNGQAVIQIYTSDYLLFFVDQEGHYCTGSVDYQLKKLLHLDAFAVLCFEHGSEHVHLLAHLAVKAIRAARLSDTQAAVLQRAAELGCFCEHARSRLLMRLYDHYSQKKHTNLLVELLELLEPETVRRERLGEVAAACINLGGHPGMYDRAERMLSRHGVKDCDKKALLLLVKDRILKYNGGFVPLLVKWSFYLYRQGWYDNEVMNYLADFYMGSTDTLSAVYGKCRELSQGIMEDGAKERLLGQILFAGRNPMDHSQVFLEYYENGKNRVLVKAFLSEIAYEYVTDRLELTEEIFVKIEKEAFYVRDTVMVLAALKYYSAWKTFAWKQKEFIERNLEQFASEGLILTFMKRFIGKTAVPYEIENTLIIQYNSGTQKGVFLHTGTGDGRFETEPMRRVFDGIYIKELLLFSDEEKICYIEEEETGKKTDRIHVKQMKTDAPAPGFFQMVNEMIRAKEEHDEEKYEQLRRRYERQHAVAERLFKLQ